MNDTVLLHGDIHSHAGLGSVDPTNWEIYTYSVLDSVSQPRYFSYI